MSIYDFEVEKMDGEKISLREYEGMVMLIMNSATQCGFTPQYDRLQSMFEEFGDRGFIILDFPCDQFGHQAPGTNEEIAYFCDAKYGVSFPIFAKIEVNGENQLPLFAYLKEQKGFGGFGNSGEMVGILESVCERMDPDYKNNSNIKWNFTKFLVDREGNVVERFEPTIDLDDVANKVEELL